MKIKFSFRDCSLPHFGVTRRAWNYLSLIVFWSGAEATAHFQCCQWYISLNSQGLLGKSQCPSVWHGFHMIQEPRSVHHQIKYIKAATQSCWQGYCCTQCGSSFMPIIGLSKRVLVYINLAYGVSSHLASMKQLHDSCFTEACMHKHGHGHVTFWTVAVRLFESHASHWKLAREFNSFQSIQSKS